jgi:hypothetical protein
LELSEAFVCDAPEDDERRAATAELPATSLLSEEDSSAEEGAESELLLPGCGAEKEAEA